MDLQQNPAVRVFWVIDLYDISHFNMGEIFWAQNDFFLYKPEKVKLKLNSHH